MIRTNQITPTQLSVSHNGNHLGQFSKMTPGVWGFIPSSTTVYTASLLRDITDTISRLGVAGTVS